MKQHLENISGLKKELRAQFREKRRALSPEEKAARDVAICKNAISMASFRFAEYVLLYAPTKYEVDVMPIAEAALAKGKKILFPRCDTLAHTMKYHFVSSVSELEDDAYGILAPPQSAPVYNTEDKAPAVCIVPGLIYDRCGYRVGYGGGYYDRFLIDFKGCKAGVIYSDFIVQSVPRGRFDHKVDIMLTEKNVRIPLEG